MAAGTLALTGNVTAVATGRFLILDGGGNGTLSGVVSNNGANIPGIQKEGSGTWTLTSTSINTYTASTQINGGTLLVNGSTASGSPASVDSGATLGGSGTVAGAVNAATGSKIAPGSAASSAGTLNTGAATLSGTLAIDVNGAIADKLNVTGNLSLGAASAVTVNLLAGGFTQTNYIIAQCSGTLSGTFASVPSGYQVTYTTNQAVLSKLSGYTTWASTNANGDAANLDTDGDGVPNGVEYLMGQTGSTFTVNPSLSSGSVTWPKDPTAVATYVVQNSTELSTWNTASSGVTDTGTSVTYTIPTGDPARFARLKVTVP